MKKIILTLLFSIWTLVFISCGETTKNKISKQRIKTVLDIPSDVSYSIEKDIKDRNKRVVDIILNKRVNKKVLENIALWIREKNEKIYIGYFLGKENVGYGYWARSNFTPNLTVKILGATLEEEQVLRKKLELTPERKLIGSWLNDINPYNAILEKLTFFKEANSTFLEITYTKGSPSIIKMVIKDDPILGLKIYQNKYYKRD